MYQDADTDEDGSIDFANFCALMKALDPKAFIIIIISVL